MPVVKARRARYVQLDARLEDIIADYSPMGDIKRYLNLIVDCFHQDFNQDEFDSEISEEISD